MQYAGPVFPQARVQRFANFRRHCRHAVKPGHQCPQVKPGSSNNHRDGPGVMAPADNRQRRFAPAAGGTSFAQTKRAVQMMRDRDLIIHRRAGGNDPQIAIDLHGVSVDDFAAEFLRYAKRESGFAARRRAADDDDGPGGQPFVILSATKRCAPPLSINTSMVFSLAFLACSTFFRT